MRQTTIRKPQPTEIEAIIKIWLDGNIQAHPFIAPGYWARHVEYMRKSLPGAEVYVYEQENEIVGFVGIENSHVAGLFVDRDHQSQGIGTSLIEFIKEKHFTLTLAVYKKNERATQFYRKHNFVAMEERIDPDTNEAELLMRWNRACPI